MLFSLIINKIMLKLCLLATLLVSSLGLLERRHRNIEKDSFDLTRGLIQGYYEGLYDRRNFQLDGKCLGEPFQESSHELLSIFTHFKFSKFTKIFYYMWQISSDIDRFCHFQDFYDDVWNFCNHSPHNPCSPAKIPKNL